MRWMLLACAVVGTACTFGTTTAGTGTGAATVGGSDGGDETTGALTTNGAGTSTGDSPADDGETTAAGEDSDTTQSSAGEAESESGSGAVDPFCGDGNEDPGEDCDDGDKVNANGCTNLCAISGSVDWSQQLPGVSAFSELLRGVVYHPDVEAYYAVGYHVGPSGSYDSLRIQVDPTGTIALEVSPDTGNLEVDAKIALTDMGELAVIGDLSSDIRIEFVDVNLDIVQTRTYSGSTAGDDVGWGIAFNDLGEGVAVGGWLNATGVDAWVHRINSAGADGWTLTGLSPTDDFFRDVVWAEESKSFYASLNDVAYDAPARVVQFSSAGVELGAYNLGDTIEMRARGVAADADGVYVCGYSVVAGVSNSRVYALEFDGTPRWDVEWLGADGLGAYCVALAVDGAGDLVTVGGSYEQSQIDTGVVDRPTVRKLSANTGEDLWTTLLDLPGHPFGGLTGVTTGPNNRIVAVGGANTEGSQTNPVIVSLQP